MTDEESRQVHLSLYHSHVPKLADLGIVEYQQAGDIIVRSRNTEQVQAVLDGVGAEFDQDRRTTLVGKTLQKSRTLREMTMPADSNDDNSVAETDESTPDDVPSRVNSDDPDEYVDTEEWVQAHQSRYDSASDEELVAALVSAVADVKGVDPLNHHEMPPLYDIYDTETLEATFFGHSPGTTQEELGIMTFTYNGYKVALRSDGWIFVYEPR